MNRCRNQLSAVLYNDEAILAIGGQDEVGNRLSSVESYSFVTQQWSNFSPMTIARSGHRATACNGMLYVIGGFSTKSIECYDSMSSSWRLDDHFTNAPRDRAVVVNMTSDSSRVYAEESFEDIEEPTSPTYSEI